MNWVKGRTLPTRVTIDRGGPSLFLDAIQKARTSQGCYPKGLVPVELSPACAGYSAYLF
jgi:hypothetical protein